MIRPVRRRLRESDPAVRLWFKQPHRDNHTAPEEQSSSSFQKGTTVRFFAERPPQLDQSDAEDAPWGFENEPIRLRAASA